MSQKKLTDFPVARAVQRIFIDGRYLRDSNEIFGKFITEKDFSDHFGVLFVKEEKNGSKRQVLVQGWDYSVQSLENLFMMDLDSSLEVLKSFNHSIGSSDFIELDIDAHAVNMLIEDILILVTNSKKCCLFALNPMDWKLVGPVEDTSLNDFITQNNLESCVTLGGISDFIAGCTGCPHESKFGDKDNTDATDTATRSCHIVEAPSRLPYPLEFDITDKGIDDTIRSLNFLTNDIEVEEEIEPVEEVFPFPEFVIRDIEESARKLAAEYGVELELPEMDTITKNAKFSEAEITIRAGSQRLLDDFAGDLMHRIENKYYAYFQCDEDQKKLIKLKESENRLRFYELLDKKGGDVGFSVVISNSHSFEDEGTKECKSTCHACDFKRFKDEMGPHSFFEPFPPQSFCGMILNIPDVVRNIVPSERKKGALYCFGLAKMYYNRNDLLLDGSCVFGEMIEKDNELPIEYFKRTASESEMCKKIRDVMENYRFERKFGHDNMTLFIALNEMEVKVLDNQSINIVQTLTRFLKGDKHLNIMFICHGNGFDERIFEVKNDFPSQVKFRFLDEANATVDCDQIKAFAEVVEFMNMHERYAFLSSMLTRIGGEPFVHADLRLCEGVGLFFGAGIAYQHTDLTRQFVAHMSLNQPLLVPDEHKTGVAYWLCGLLNLPISGLLFFNEPTIRFVKSNRAYMFCTDPSKLFLAFFDGIELHLRCHQDVFNLIEKNIKCGFCVFSTNSMNNQEESMRNIEEAAALCEIDSNEDLAARALALDSIGKSETDRIKSEDEVRCFFQKEHDERLEEERKTLGEEHYLQEKLKDEQNPIMPISKDDEVILKLIKNNEAEKVLLFEESYSFLQQQQYSYSQHDGQVVRNFMVPDSYVPEDSDNEINVKTILRGFVWDIYTVRTNIAGPEREGHFLHYSLLELILRTDRNARGLFFEMAFEATGIEFDDDELIKYAQLLFGRYFQVFIFYLEEEPVIFEDFLSKRSECIKMLWKPEDCEHLEDFDCYSLCDGIGAFFPQTKCVFQFTHVFEKSPLKTISYEIAENLPTYCYFPALEMGRYCLGGAMPQLIEKIPSLKTSLLDTLGWDELKIDDTDDCRFRIPETYLKEAVLNKISIWFKELHKRSVIFDMSIHGNLCLSIPTDYTSLDLVVVDDWCFAIVVSPYNAILFSTSESNIALFEEENAAKRSEIGNKIVELPYNCKNQMQKLLIEVVINISNAREVVTEWLMSRCGASSVTFNENSVSLVVCRDHDFDVMPDVFEAFFSLWTFPELIDGDAFLFACDRHEFVGVQGTIGVYPVSNGLFCLKITHDRDVEDTDDDEDVVETIWIEFPTSICRDIC